MLCEIECRALSAAHQMLIQDFEPKDALTYLEGQKIFTEDHSDRISTMLTRMERIAQFLRIYRRHASELAPLIAFFEFNNQNHLSDFLDNFIYFAINEPEQLKPVMIAPAFSEQMLNRKLLLGNVPKQSASYQRNDIVEILIDHLDVLSDQNTFFLFVHGRAGSGKSVIASQALSHSDRLIGVAYDAVVWLKDGGVTGKSTFDLFSDLLLMLKRGCRVCDTDDSITETDFTNRVLSSRSEDDLLNFPNIENVTTVGLKKMIANALIDRPNTLFVFDDVVREDTIRWAQELGLRCLVTTRDIDISNVVSVALEYVEIPPFEPSECHEMLESMGMPPPTSLKDDEIVSRTVELTSGNPAILMQMFKLCEPKRFEKLALLNNKLETRGLSGLECITPYPYKSYTHALRRCVEVLSDEDKSALAYAVVMPPNVNVPIKIWSYVCPVDVCSNEEGDIEEEVSDTLKRLHKRGALLCGKRSPVLTFRVDHIIHFFLKHAVDHPSIIQALKTLEVRLQEYNNNNKSTPQTARRYDHTMIDEVIPMEQYGNFMEIHKDFYDNLKKFVSGPSKYTK